VKDTPEVIRKIVHVRAGGRRDLVARLAKLEAGSVVIGSPGSETDSYTPRLAEPIEIGLITANGILWYTGVVAEIEPGAELLLHVRLGETQPGAERRAHPRAPDSLPVDITVPGAPQSVSGRLIDVSTGGLRVEAPIALEVGDIVGMTLHVQGANPIQATARVMHVHPQSPASGLRFELAVARDREWLVQRAFERLALVGWRTEAAAPEQNQTETL
jgi:PilZ domain-containing protein